MPKPTPADASAPALLHTTVAVYEAGQLAPVYTGHVIAVYAGDLVDITVDRPGLPLQLTGVHPRATSANGSGYTVVA